MRREIDILYNYWEENRIITADMRKDDKNITQIIRKGSDNEFICEAVNDYVGRKMKDTYDCLLDRQQMVQSALIL